MEGREKKGTIVQVVEKFFRLVKKNQPVFREPIENHCSNFCCSSNRGFGQRLIYI